VTPIGFLVTYPLASLTILIAVSPKRRRSDFWQRSAPRRLVGAQLARFTHLSSESTATKRDDWSLGREANESRESASPVYVPVIGKVGQEQRN
jgi:hypothetical protein